MSWAWRAAAVLALALALALGRLAALVADVRAGNRAIAEADPAGVRRKARYLDGVRAEHAERGTAGAGRRPNVVFVLFDDMGYGDLGCTGNKVIRTPRLDAVAAEGAVFEQFYSASCVCSPSRSSLLTGRLPVRTGVPSVIFPEGSTAMRAYAGLLGRSHGLLADEVTLPEVFQAAGYATGMVGKWHLGDTAGHLPNDFGFDSYFGVHYSNDMLPLPVYRDGAVVDASPTDQGTLTERYVAETARFIERAAREDAPFFLYVATNMPHIPLFPSARSANKSRAGLYGDVVEDLDWQVGHLVDALKAARVYDSTVLVVSSDNGPWFEGSGGGRRGRKGEAWDGGQRVPFLWRDPALPGLAGHRFADPAWFASGLDLFPTLVQGYLGTALPADRVIDGVNLLPALRAAAAAPAGATTAPDAAAAALAGIQDRSVFMYLDMHAHALRRGNFKMHLPHALSYTCLETRWFSFCPALHLGRHPLLYDDKDSLGGQADAKGRTTYHEPRWNAPWLFNLADDPLESYDTTQVYPAVAQAMSRTADHFTAAVAANPRGWLAPP